MHEYVLEPPPVHVQLARSQTYPIELGQKEVADPITPVDAGQGVVSKPPFWIRLLTPVLMESF
jgi:hypothetical protein